MTRAEVDNVLRLLAVNYDRDLTTNPELVALWREVLAPYDGAAVREAALRHMVRSPFWPKLSDLLTTVARAGQLDVDEAWALVLEQVQRVGYYGRPQWSDPLVAETVDRIGWAAICTSPAPDIIRAQFRLFYTQAQERATTRRTLQVLTGGAGVARLPAGPPPEATPE